MHFDKRPRDDSLQIQFLDRQSVIRWLRKTPMPMLGGQPPWSGVGRGPFSNPAPILSLPFLLVHETLGQWVSDQGRRAT